MTYRKSFGEDIGQLNLSRNIGGNNVTMRYPFMNKMIIHLNMFATS